MLQIRFEKLLKEKLPGEGNALEEAASAASASLPHLLSFGRLKREEVVHEMDALRVRNLDIRQSEGVAIPMAICRKVF